ncbi:MAG: hypothetical protein SFW67_36140 [Myxococcaceae bacterium]|nr:hypothetical protein [Myxococcaceae bacterium]
MRASRSLLLLAWMTACGFEVPLGFDDAGPCALEPRVAGHRVDATFGTCGVVRVDVAGVDNVGLGTQGLAIDPTGRALLAGTAGTPADRDLAVVRLTEAGALDSTFGMNGVGQVSVTTADIGHGLSLSVDGTIFIAGESKTIGNEPIAVLGKLLPSGQPDPAFGVGGHEKVSVAFGNPGACLGVWRRDDGSVVCTGTSWNVFPGPGDLVAIARDGTAAQPATGFGASGSTVVDFGGLDQRGNAGVATASGQLVLPGRTSAGAASDFALARLDSSGRLDPSFTDARGLAGLVQVDLPGNDDECLAAFAAPDGAVWCMGRARTLANTFEGALVRVLASGAVDPSFGVDGRVVLPTFSAVWAMAPLDDGTFLIAGDAQGGAGTGALALQVVDGAGRAVDPLVTFDVTSGPDSARAVVRDAHGRLWVAGAANRDWVVLRFVRDARPSTMRVANECASAPSWPLLLMALWVVLRRWR